MSKHAVVNVATTGYYQKGQRRLVDAFAQLPNRPALMAYPTLSAGWPSHQQRPYAFKAYALKHAADLGYTKLLWADACILPIAPLEPIWARAAEAGVWICRNGWTNYEWTADSAYPDLFLDNPRPFDLEYAREQNRAIPHVVATTFALDLDHPKGKAFLAEYYWLASGTEAFCGPWTNAQPVNDSMPTTDPTGRIARCGPADVRGHRHDQTAASVIAWRLGIPLVDPPAMFAYKGGETKDTILVADGAY